MERLRRKKKKNNDFEMIKNSILRIVVFSVIVGLNWTGLSAIIETNSYLSDIENSESNTYTAGTLDFILTSPEDFSPIALSPGEVATRTIDVINFSNIHKYTVTATSFEGALCDYLNLEANLDGGDIEYSGKLTEFSYGPIVFEEPENWFSTLALPADAPESVQGTACQFNFLFFGSQTKNDLLFGQGFNDTEEIINNIAAKVCRDVEIRSMGYWKNHASVYLPHLPQYLGATGTDELIDTQQKAEQVFDDYNLSMRNKLRGQLLAMKFNIAHLGIGDYFVESEGKTLNQIVEDADNLLRQAPQPPKGVLEAMKDLLDGLNNLHQIRACSLTPPPIIEPELTLPNIVINEFLPNPIGNDKTLMPNGEWIELYNNTGEDVDVAGWWLYDAVDSHELAITVSNTNTGNTIIPNEGFLVVYRNGDSDFSLNNTVGDTVRLYDGAIGVGNLIDFYTYTGDAPEGKSFARVPDGSNNWVDPIPTPGEPNTLEDESIVFGPAVSEPDEEIIDEGEELIIQEEIENKNSTTTTEETPTENVGAQANNTDNQDNDEPIIEQAPAIEEQPAIVPDDNGIDISDGETNSNNNEGDSNKGNTEEAGGEINTNAVDSIQPPAATSEE